MRLDEIRYIDDNTDWSQFADVGGKEPDEEQKRKIRIKMTLSDCVKNNTSGPREKFTFNEDETISIDGDVTIKDKDWRHLPEIIEFDEIDGNFTVIKTKMSSWKGFPTQIHGYLDVSYNRFDTLEGSPIHISEGFNCSHNQLKTLKGMTDYPIQGEFDCSHNDLTTLEGGPESVEGDYDCRGNQFEDFKGIAKEIDGKIWAQDNQHLTSLVGIGDMITSVNGVINMEQSTIEKGGLGLVLIKGCTCVYFKPESAAKIINEFIGQPDKIFECQQKLIEAGFEDIAVL